MSDGAGHGKPEKRPVFQKVFSQFEERLIKQWNLLQPATLEEAKQLLVKEVGKLNFEVENISNAATLSFVIVLKGHDKNYMH